MGRKRKRSENVEGYQETYYSVVEGVRYVVPYVHDFLTFAKGRWLNRNIVDVLTKEFGAHQPSYWLNAINNGHILINNKITTTDYIFKNSDAMLHRTHRHEPPIVGNITFVGQTDDLLAVCKPPSVPMHPCGSYRFNSLMYILAKEPVVEDQPPLFLVHRLDRVTSGLVVLAKSSAVAGVISEEIRKKETKKFYYARVKGRFPNENSIQMLEKLEVDSILQFSGEDLDDVDMDEQKVMHPIPRGKTVDSSGSSSRCNHNENYDVAVAPAPAAPAAPSNILDRPTILPVTSTVSTSNEHITLPIPNIPNTNETQGTSSTANSSSKPLLGYCYDSQGDIILRYPIDVISHREGIYTCHPNGKTSITSFRCLGYHGDDDTSLVECRPLTGRTHQIRLHLQLLGTPIANDPCYGGELFYRQPEKKRKALEMLSAMKKLGHQPLSKVPHILHIDNNWEVEVAVEVPSPLQTGTNATDASVAADDQNHIIDNGISSSSNSTETLPDPKPSSSSSTTSSLNSAPKRENETDNEYLIRTCRYCQEPYSEELERLLHCDGIWLHALRYEGRGWSFEAPTPDWANSSIFSR